MTDVIQKIKKLSFFKEISIAPLIIFRIIFGALMLFGVLRFISKGWVEQLYMEPQYYFGYLGFEWVKPLEGELIYIPFVLMVIAAVLIILGGFYRVATIVFFVCFTYVELLDKSNYLNHYYFVSLMSFLMIWLPANGKLSVDAWLFPKLRKEKVHAWQINIIKFQLAVVYIFAGIAKINSDWLLEAQPLKTWLQAHHHIPIVGPYLQESWVAFVFSWSGCIYDLFIVYFLISNRTRPFAYLFVVFFHLVTWYLFPIGVFPWVMIFSTLIFFSEKFHQKVLEIIQKTLKITHYTTTETQSSPGKPVVKWLVGCYVAIQLLVPLRFVLYPGDLFWNEEGFRFSWRVMLMHKEGYATFFVRDKSTGRESEINNAKFLTKTQEDQMATQPDMILQYARILKDYHNGKKLTYGNHTFTLNEPEVYAKIYVSVNGRPSQLFVDKKQDLSLLPYNLKHRTWLEPFNE